MRASAHHVVRLKKAHKFVSLNPKKFARNDCSNRHWAQHDEVEPNLKKILHTNGIWGLEANSL